MRLKPTRRSRKIEGGTPDSSRDPQRPRTPLANAPQGLARTVLAALLDLAGILREMLAWPVRLWLGAAELVGTGVLAVWRSVSLPALRLLLRVASWALRVGEREVTPVRALCVVALAASVSLGASQFSDYRAVEVGAPEYRGVENVAPAPQVDQQTPRSAHGVSVFAIAIASLFVTVFAAARNWRLARLLLFLGAAVVLISLIGDASEGLQEGVAGTAYQGAKAVLLGGFWAQLMSGVTLMVVGPLLATQLRAARDARRSPGRARGAPARGLQRSSGGTGMEEPAT
jgi:hypothetical protein